MLSLCSSQSSTAIRRCSQQIFSMQAIVNRTRHQQSVSACINFARAIPTICETVTSSASYLSLSDRLQSFSTASNSSKAASSCCTLRGSSSNPFNSADRTFASTAEFSGGSFSVSSSSSSSESDDNRQSGHSAETDTKEMLLESSLGHVMDKGWTDAALIAGAQHIGLSPAAIGLLPRGPAELVEYFEDKCNSELTSILQSRKAEWQQLRTVQRVKQGLEIRLEMNAPYIDVWAQALSIRAQPRNVPYAIKQIAQITDDVWHAAGDKSTDYNWYTKRGLLASVYTSTELYMLTDYSPGFADTWDVLDRRLQDVMTVGRVMGQVGSSAKSLAEQVSNTLSQLLVHHPAQYQR